MSDQYTIRTPTVNPNDPEDYFELGDDEEVIDTVRHGLYTKVYILTPVGFECGYIKDNSEPCEITVSGPNERCHHHND